MTSIRDRWPFQSLAHGKPSSSDVVVAGSRVAPEGRGPFVKHQQQPKLKNTHNTSSIWAKPFFLRLFSTKRSKEFFCCFAVKVADLGPGTTASRTPRTAKAWCPPPLFWQLPTPPCWCAAWASRTPGRKAKEEKEARRKSWSQLLGICENKSIHYAQHSEISLWPSEGVHIFQMLTCALSGQTFASGQRKSVVWPSKRSDERSLKSRRRAEEKAISDEVQTDHRDLLEDLISQEFETLHLFTLFVNILRRFFEYSTTWKLIDWAWSAVAGLASKTRRGPTGEITGKFRILWCTVATSFQSSESPFTPILPLQTRKKKTKT